MENDFFDLPDFGDVDAAAHVDDLSLQNWDILKGKEIHQDEVPPVYEHIYMNEFMHRKHLKQKEEDIVVCVCQLDANDPDSACGERCLNVLTSTECTRGYCPCGVFCNNQKFQKCEYPSLRLFKTEDRGWSLLAAQNIEAGQFVIEYCGEVISWKEARQRSHLYESEGTERSVNTPTLWKSTSSQTLIRVHLVNAGLRDAYIISLNASESIDATRKGNLARFINHSCQPNCETRKWTVLGEIRVGIFAKQAIPTGTELSYDYNFEWFGGAKVRCLCGASCCSGFLGAKSRGFQEAFYLWEDDDAGYSVDNIPLYDSGEDDSSLKLIPVAGGGDEFRPFDYGGERSLSAPMEVEPLDSVPAGSGEAAADRQLSENAEISRVPSSGGNSRRLANGKAKSLVRKQLDVKLLAERVASPDLLVFEAAREKAAAELDAVYDEIRPAIEEHERDTQDSVSTAVAEKWIEASCVKLKADFDLFAAVVKAVAGNPTPTPWR